MTSVTILTHGDWYIYESIMNISDTNWEDYFRAIEGRVVHPLLLDALNLFTEEMLDSSRFAIDLGCGDGTETAWLLEQGWDVLAVDGDPNAIKYLMKKVRRNQLGRLQTQIAKFEDMLLAPADLIHAAFSLPFCSPENTSTTFGTRSSKL